MIPETIRVNVDVLNYELTRLNEENERLKEEVKQLKEALGEMIPISNDAVSLLDEYQHNWEIVQRHKQTILKASKLLTE